MNHTPIRETDNRTIEELREQETYLLERIRAKDIELRILRESLAVSEQECLTLRKRLEKHYGG